MRIENILSYDIVSNLITLYTYNIHIIIINYIQIVIGSSRYQTCAFIIRGGTFGRLDPAYQGKTLMPIPLFKQQKNLTLLDRKMAEPLTNHHFRFPQTSWL